MALGAQVPTMLAALILALGVGLAQWWGLRPSWMNLGADWLSRRIRTTKPAPTPAPPPAPTPPFGPIAVRIGGLDTMQVQARMRRGDVNVVSEGASRDVWSIVRGNVLTRFNALLGALFIIVVLIGPWQDALFGFSIAVNTTIGLVQELRAKRLLDRLVIVSAPSARVLRDGSIRQLPVAQIVLDDVVELCKGDQVPVDGRVLSAECFEVDQSILTGESSTVLKAAGDDVLSGTLVVAGQARVQATRVGVASYGRTLAAEARALLPRARSELQQGIDVLLGWVAWLAPPMCAVLVARQLVHAEAGWRDAVLGSIAATEGMIPQGLVLLTSVAMAVAVLRLGRRNVVVQELAAVEALARADVLCIDKTGTLTTGRLELEAVVPVERATWTTTELQDALGFLARAEATPDPVAAAIAKACPRQPDPVRTVVATVPFSSERRWRAATVDRRCTWVLGAPAAVFGPEAGPAHAEAERIAATGRRVLALGCSPAPIARDVPMAAQVTPAALVVLVEELRPDAKATLQYLCAQGIAVKVISGDDTRTASVVAQRAGVAHAGKSTDGDALPHDADELENVAARTVVFGRVTPHRKRDLVAALRRRGHVVAMMGDGVNDVLALKDADLGIAVGTAAGAARAVARVVLLDGFSALPDLLSEGRRIIANVERSAHLFVTKTLYMLLISLSVMLVGVPFPLLPRQNTLAGSLSVGIPGFFLALAPNAARARRGFLSRVLRFVAPAACMGAAASLAAFGVARGLHPGDLPLARTAVVLTLTAWGLSLVCVLPGQRQRLPAVLIPAVLAALLGALLVEPLRGLFGLEVPPMDVWISIVALGAMAHAGLQPIFVRLARAVDV